MPRPTCNTPDDTCAVPGSYLEGQPFSCTASIIWSGPTDPAAFATSMVGAGLVDVSTVSRNAWYRQQAEAELARLRGPLYEIIGSRAEGILLQHEVVIFRDKLLHARKQLRIDGQTTVERISGFRNQSQCKLTLIHNQRVPKRRLM